MRATPATARSRRARGGRRKPASGLSRAAVTRSAAALVRTYESQVPAAHNLDVTDRLPSPERTIGVLEKLVEVLAVYPVVKTRPFFDVMEKAEPGSGGLYSVNVDPWKCSGCGECVDVCGPGALTVQTQNHGVQISLQNSFEFLSKMPNTAPRFTETALQPGGDAKPDSPPGRPRGQDEGPDRRPQNQERDHGEDPDTGRVAQGCPNGRPGTL